MLSSGERSGRRRHHVTAPASDEKIAEVERPVSHRARNRHRGMRAEPLAMLLQRPLEGLALADPQPLLASLVAKHFLPVDFESVDLIGGHGG